MKHLAILIITSFALGNAAAQSGDMPRSIYVNGAFNLAALPASDYYFNSEANPGFSGGAMFRTDGDLYLLAGIQYVNVSPTMQYWNGTIADEVNMQLLQIPVMAGLHVAKSPDLKRALHLNLGGSFSTLLDIGENDLGITKDDLKSTGFTVKTGIGADLWRFVVDLNYNLLLTHVYDIAGYNNKAKLMCWELSIGYRFDLKQK